jgi:integrase
MSIYRRGSIWWIELTTNAGRLRESSRTTDKRAAQEYHEKRKSEIWRQEQLGEPAPITWAEASDRWLEIKDRGLPDIYRLKALKVDPNATLPLTKSQVPPKTYNRTLALIVAIHNAVGIDPPEIEKSPQTPGRTRWLTAEEWTRLRSALEDESQLLRQIADFSIATGVRENNALELEWSQVDMRRRVAWFYGDQMKGRVAHGIPLSDAAIAALEERRGAHKTYVFAHPDSGRPLYKASNRAWYNALRKTKLKATGVVWHTLRHTWASWFVMNGGTLQELMELGGWKSYSMVLRYAHLAPEHLAEAAARVKPISLRYNAPKRTKVGTKSPTKGR